MTDTQVDSICRQVTGQADWPQLTDRQALVIAVFGRRYAEDARYFLQSASAWQQLVQYGEYQVIVFTNLPAVFSSISWVTVLPVQNIPDWPAGDRYANRFCKWALPFLLPDIPASVFVDTLNVIPVNRSHNIRQLFADVSDAEFVVTEHMRESWHAEYAAIKRWQTKVSDSARLEQQKDYYEQQGLPDTQLVYKNSLLGRLHASEAAQLLSTVVLQQLHQFSERDQLALPYAVFTTGIQPAARPNGCYLATAHGQQVVDAKRIVAIHRNVQRRRLPLMLRLIFLWRCWRRGQYSQL